MDGIPQICLKWRKNELFFFWVIERLNEEKWGMIFFLNLTKKLRDLTSFLALKKLRILYRKKDYCISQEKYSCMKWTIWKMIFNVFWEFSILNIIYNLHGISWIYANVLELDKIKPSLFHNFINKLMCLYYLLKSQPVILTKSLPKTLRINHEGKMNYGF